MTSYQANIPTGLVNLDTDYQNIQNNFSQLDTTYGVNHVKYSVVPNNGKHTYVEMINQAAIPSPLAANEGTIYTKLVSGISQEFYSPDNTGNEYQMTTANTTNFATFATFTNYPTPVANQNGGWTFLPGGLLLQYGTMTTVNNNQIIKFPIAFTTVYSVTFATNQTDWALLSTTNSQFTVGAGTGAGVIINWMAIGKQ